MEIGAEQLYEQAFGHFRAGAAEETGRAAEAIVSQAPGLEAGWFLKALAAAGEGRATLDVHCRGS